MAKSFLLIGCCGRNGLIYTRKIANEENAKVYLFSRNPSQVESKLPSTVTIVKGNIFSKDSILSAIESVKGNSKKLTIVLSIPVFERDMAQGDIAVTEATLYAIKKQTNYPVSNVDIIFLSPVLVPMKFRCNTICAKYDCENLIKHSGINFTFLRWGIFMNQEFDVTLPFLRRGLIIWPHSARSKVSFTHPEDLGKLILFYSERPTNDHVDVVESNFYDLGEFTSLVEKVTENLNGERMRFYVFPPILLYWILFLIKPFTWYLFPKVFTFITIMLSEFESPVVGDPNIVKQDVTEFKLNTLQDYLMVHWRDDEKTKKE